MIKQYHENIYWCFGNHDIGLVFQMLGLMSNDDIEKKLHISKSAILAHPLLFGYDGLKREFETHLLANNYLVYYLLDGIKCSNVPRKSFMEDEYGHYYDRDLKRVCDVIDLFNKKLINADDLEKVFTIPMTEYVYDEPNYYYGYLNILRHDLNETNGYHGTVENILSNACKDIANKRSNCCDLSASTFTYNEFRQRVKAFELISRTELYVTDEKDSNGKLKYKRKCYNLVINYRTILKSLHII